MIAIFDVHYQDPVARAACLLIEAWASSQPILELTEQLTVEAPYVAGELYRRELPCILSLFRKLPTLASPLEAIVVDGFVWLETYSKPGLGAHLYQALDAKIPVVGVAKNWLPGADPSCAVLRGGSRRPLYVSAAGIDLEIASEHVRNMAGDHRIPFILKCVDRLSRSRAPGDPRPMA